MPIRILKTLAITIIYCLIWVILELIIYGEQTARIVDDIIMMLFIPMIWKASKDKRKEEMNASLKPLLESIMELNIENINNEHIGPFDDKSYAKGYAEGLHDGVLDVMVTLEIETDEEYYN